MYINETIQKTQ